MVEVTDKKYFLDKRILDKVDLACQMIENDNDDAILVITGKTGSGKTNLSKAYGYYAAKRLNREFSSKQFFFYPESWCQYVSSTRKKVVVWDEAALGCLSNQYASKIQRTIVSILMMCRSRNHFLIFNIPKFNKLASYIREECIGFINTYKNVELGKKSEYKYCYMRFKDKEYINHLLSKKKLIQSYSKFNPLIDRSPHPDYFKDIVDEEEAEKRKSEAIKKLGISLMPDGKIKLDKNAQIITDFVAAKWDKPSKSVPVSEVCKVCGKSRTWVGDIRKSRKDLANKV